MEKVKIAIVEWCEWLKGHGDSVPEMDFKPKIKVAEVINVDYNPAEAGKPEPLFWSEVLPVQRKDIERTIRLMEYSRNDLLSFVSKLTEEHLDWRPPNKPRTIRNCLEHIAWVEPWYISRLNIELPKDYPKDLFKLLDYTRHIVNECLRNFPRSKMRGIFQPRRDKSPRCNLWTARKVLRRLVDHERLHTRYIEKVLKMH